MPYKNGREVKIGDFAIKRNSDGKIYGGVVVAAYPGAASCNMTMAVAHLWPIQKGNCQTLNAGSSVSVDSDGVAQSVNPSLDSCQNSAEFPHADDALKAFEKLEAALP